jgi:hypothetical protein
MEVHEKKYSDHPMYFSVAPLGFAVAIGIKMINRG